MRKPENGQGIALRLTVPVLTALSLIFYRVLTASSFESTENVTLVTVLLVAALALGAVAAFKDVLHVPSFLTFTALAAAAAGADGLMIEVHNDPPRALCDGPQSLTPEQFDDVARAVRTVRAALRPHLEG